MNIQSDDVCEQLVTSLKAWLNAASSLWLRLWQNDFTPTPSTQTPSLYNQPGYPGYAQIAVLNTWGQVTRSSSGVWYIQSGPWNFAPNGGIVPVTVFGWNLVRNNRSVFAERFDGPVIIGPGRLGPPLLLRLTQASQAQVCPCP